MIYVIIFIFIVVCDRSIKAYIEKKMLLGAEESIWNDTITVTRYHNKGAFLNILEKKLGMIKVLTGILAGLLLLALAFLIPQKENRLLKLGISLLAGGAVSNLADRIEKGYVVDYFSFRFKKPNCLKKINDIVFNLGDMAIFLGSILIMVRLCLSKTK